MKKEVCLEGRIVGMHCREGARGEAAWSETNLVVGKGGIVGERRYRRGKEVS